MIYYFYCQEIKQNKFNFKLKPFQFNWLNPKNNIQKFKNKK